MQNITAVSGKSGTRLGWGERLGFGVGNIGWMAVYAVFSSYLTIYLTNVALLDIGIVAVIVAVSKVFDGISDLIAGNIIDRTRSKFGKARIWLLRMCFPLAIAALLLFRIPASFPNALKYIYLFVFYNLFSTVCFTFVQISQFSMVPLLSADGKEQGLLGNIQAIFSTVGSLIGSALFVNLLPVFSSDAANPETQSGYTGALAVFCVGMVILSLIAVFTTRERVTDPVRPVEATRAAGSGTFFKTALALLRNRYWVMMFVFTVLTFFITEFDLSGSAYYASYIIGDMGAMGWMLGSTLAASSLIQLVTPALMGRLGKRNVYLLGAAVSAVGMAGFGLSTPHQSVMLVFNVVRGIGMGMLTAMQLGLIADTIRYTKYKSGIYSAGMGNAGIAAARKLGQGIGSAVFGLALAAAGFSAVNLTQPDGVVRAISGLYVWVPVAFFALIFISFALFFRLDRELKELENN